MLMENGRSKGRSAPCVHLVCTYTIPPLVVVHVILEGIKITLPVYSILMTVHGVKQVIIILTLRRLHALSVRWENILNQLRKHVRRVKLERIQIAIPGVIAGARILRRVQAVKQVRML